MYAQVRHHWHTRPVRVIPKGLTCAAGLQHSAPGSSQPFVYLPLSIQRSQARSKYIHVCSGAPSLAHKACTRYTDRPNLRCWFPAPSSLHSTVLCLTATFDTTLAGTQQVHPCMLRCAILGAQGLYALYRKAELVLLAPSSSQYFVYLPLSIQRSQARSKYIHVCSGAPSWRTRPVRVKIGRAHV